MDKKSGQNMLRKHDTRNRDVAELRKEIEEKSNALRHKTAMIKAGSRTIATGNRIWKIQEM